MTEAGNSPTVEAIRARLTSLQKALANGSSKKYCLRLWSDFIRERDGYRCVDCHSTNRLSAHHICRKSFISGAQFDTGNGITLCESCHREVHIGFNGRPDFSQPVDSQGGEKLALMERLYSILTDDAVDRDMTYEEFYFLSDNLLSTFKKMQGYTGDTLFPGARIEQAYLILAECEFHTRRALAESNGAPPVTKPLLPGGLYFVVNDNQGKPIESIVIQNYLPRWDTINKKIQVNM